MSSFREFLPARVGDFMAAGYKEREFFPHRAYVLPKCGPDGFKLAERMCGATDSGTLREVVLYATSPLLERFPDELFFDDDLIWHQQQFGRKGQVATANLHLKGNEIYTMVHISDLVQRSSRVPEHRTQIENRFRGWFRLLSNSILDFAAAHGFSAVYSPTSGFALEHTDPARNVLPQLFERVYDRGYVPSLEVVRDGPWWKVDVQKNRDRIVSGAHSVDELQHEKMICVIHHTERGMGHRDVEPSFSRKVDALSSGWLEEMLAIERSAGVTTTYCVVGELLAEVRESIEAGGHEVAFHSYDHAMDQLQLGRCRDLDYRLKGYAPPRAELTAELTTENLCRHNFEWLATSTYSLGGLKDPALRNGLAVIPIQFDDFPLHSEGLPYDPWEAGALEAVEHSNFLAFGLHDCYGDLWLPRYADFLERLQQIGSLQTVKEVAFRLFFEGAE